MAIAFEKVPREFVSETAFYDYKAPMTEVLGKLNAYGAVVLMKGKEYYGIIDDRTIGRKGSVSLGKKEAAGKFAAKVPYLDQETSVAKAIHGFYEARTKALPYYEKGRITGIVKRDAMIKAILSMHMLSGYKAGGIMSTPLIAVDEATPIGDASAMMRQRKINRLVVLSEGKTLGMVTYRNILQYAAKLNSRAPEIDSNVSMKSRISEITDRNVETVGYNDGVDDAIRAIVEKKVSSLMVTRGGKPVGILTIRDLFSAVVASTAETSEGIILSGIDRSTKQYEEDILEEGGKLVEKIDRFARLKVANLAIHVKKQKVRNYEVQARLWMEHSGAYSVSAQGYSIEKTVKEAMDSLYNTVRNKKEIIYMEKKHADKEDEEE